MLEQPKRPYNSAHVVFVPASHTWSQCSKEVVGGGEGGK